MIETYNQALALAPSPPNPPSYESNPISITRCISGVYVLMCEIITTRQGRYLTSRSMSRGRMPRTLTPLSKTNIYDRYSCRRLLMFLGRSKYWNITLDPTQEEGKFLLHDALFRKHGRMCRLLLLYLLPKLEAKNQRVNGGWYCYRKGFVDPKERRPFFIDQ